MLTDDIDEKPRPEVVQFYQRPVVDQEATLKEGRTIHREATYIKISLPADKNLEVDRPIYEEDKGRYPRHWAAFQANKSQEALSGTLLSSWGHLSAAQVEDYKFMKVLTVEQLATVADAHVHKLGMGALGHRQAARDFVESAKSRAPLLRVQREMDELRAQHAALVASLALPKSPSEQLAVSAASVAAAEAAAVDAVAALDAAVDVPETPGTYVPPPRKRGRPSKSKELA